MSDKENDRRIPRRGVVKPALVGAGIGSAAVVAALLYAGKLKRQKRREDPPAG